MHRWGAQSLLNFLHLVRIAFPLAAARLVYNFYRLGVLYAPLRTRLGVLAAGVIPTVIQGSFHKEKNGKMVSNNKQGQTHAQTVAKRRAKSGGKNPPRRNFSPMGGYKDISSTHAQMAKAIRDLQMLSFKPTLPARMQKQKGKKKSSTNTKVIGGPAITQLVRAFKNPWHPKSLSCYLPTLPGRNTYKTYAENRFEAAIGKLGYGFILISPTIVNDAAAAFYSMDDTFTLTAAKPWLSSVATVGTLNTGVGVITMPFPYDSVALGTTNSAGLGKNFAMNGRIVSVGVRVFYIGNTSDEAGMTYCFVDPDHQDLTHYTLADMGIRRECEIGLNGRKECSLSAAPISVAETEFGNSSALYDGANSNVGSHYASRTAVSFPWSASYCPDALNGTADPVKTLIKPGTASTVLGVGIAPILVSFTGTPNKQVHVEIIMHVEYEGKNCEGSATPSLVDTPGTTRVIAAVNKAYAIKSSNKASFATAFDQALRECK